MYVFIYDINILEGTMTENLNLNFGDLLETHNPVVTRSLHYLFTRILGRIRVRASTANISMDHCSVLPVGKM